MEQARYWMWTKTKHSSLSNSHILQVPSTNTNPSSSYDQDSWEEQAFAEDAARGLGGCIWPPRSYSCSFCKREFRSAQALGGHMNVHRRDRARLKQSPTSTTPPPPPHHQILDHQHHHHNNPFTNALFHHYPNPQDVCTLVYNNNPNPNLDPPLIASPTSPPTRVSLLSCEKTFFPPFSSSSTTVMQQHHKRQRYSASSPPRSSNDEEELVKNHSRVVESTDISVSLNLVVRRARPAVSDDDEKDQEEEESSRIYKKRRIDASSVSSLPFVVKSKKSVEMINLCSLEELDLELRLGQRPKVK